MIDDKELLKAIMLIKEYCCERSCADCRIAEKTKDYFAQVFCGPGYECRTLKEIPGNWWVPGMEAWQ